MAVAKNNWYSSQKRASTNDMAYLTKRLFRADTAMMAHYNKGYANGNWNHFMDQTHLGYTSWNPPKVNSLDAISLQNVQAPDSAIMGVSVEGSELSWPGSSEKARLPELDIFSNREHYFEIFNQGKVPFEFTIVAPVSWLNFSESEGTVGSKDKRILVSVVEDQLPNDHAETNILVNGAGKTVLVKIKAFKPTKAAQDSIKGFVESGGLIAIEAEHFAKNIESGDRKWIKVDDYGLTLSGMRATAPVNAAPATPAKDAACLEYPVYLFSKDTARISLITSPILNFMPKRDVKIAVSFDNETPRYITIVPDKYKVHVSNPDWAKVVVDQVRHCEATLPILKAGVHTLKVWMIDPGVMLEKIIINTGGLKPSYLGPQESYFAK